SLGRPALIGPSGDPDDITRDDDFLHSWNGLIKRQLFLKISA
ncbi:13058_t:CDS:1, partial [Cetraspora pellucida]